ncbi:MAG TPA: quinol:cytochrome C oxidoreductase [Ignavibacteriales bacterium]|nr:quinol:cytochrome C oxidoreductase [Ignavibacteriales bacterium]
MSLTNENFNYRIKEFPRSVSILGWGLLALGIILIVVSFFIDRTRSSFNILISFMFLMSIGLGSLFLVALEYVAGAVWSTPIRRVSEFLSTILFIIPVLAVPLYFSMHEVFHWSHSELLRQDAVLAGKSPYLNVPFFIIRTLVCFAIWLLFYILIVRNSEKQDELKSQAITTRNIRSSAVFMPVFAITITLAAIDWMMSLEPHWFSTIFGVYYFAGTILAALASATIAVVLFIRKGYFTNITEDHLYSLGALLFAFVNFWAYIAFSQYLLIWYANLPEETTWFLLRWQGSWKIVSIALIVIHFIVPYFGLLSQPSKMNPRRLMFMSVWILFAHLFDLYWLIMPTFSRTGVTLGWMEFAFPIAAVGLVIVFFTLKAKNTNIIPIGDPKLQRGLDFRL